MYVIRGLLFIVIVVYRLRQEHGRKRSRKGTGFFVFFSIVSVVWRILTLTRDKLWKKKSSRVT